MGNLTAKLNLTKGSNSPAPKNILVKDEQGNRIQKNGEDLRLNYHGTGHLTTGTRLELTSDGFSLTTADRQAQKTPPVTEPTTADFVVIQTNKCDICVNGKYMFDDSTQRIGYFEFKGIVVYQTGFGGISKFSSDKILCNISQVNKFIKFVSVIMVKFKLTKSWNRTI